MEILAEIRSHETGLPVIMITAYGTVENAVRAMQSGAANFVQKPWDNEKLLADVRASVGWRRAAEENVQLKRALKQRYNFRKHRRQKRADAEDIRPGRASRQQPLHGAPAG
jgi:DNA-binding NtrC family response regulator